jgi:hypothetical protein
VQVIWSKLEVAIRNLLGVVIGYENLHYEADRVKARIFRTEVTDALKELRECTDGALQDLVEGSNRWIVRGERELKQVGTKLDNTAMPTFVVPAKETDGTNNPKMTGYWEADLGDGGGVGNNLYGEEDDRSIDVATNDLFQTEAETHHSSQSPTASSRQKSVRGAFSRASTASNRSEKLRESNRLRREAREALEKINEAADRLLEMEKRRET